MSIRIPSLHNQYFNGLRTWTRSFLTVAHLTRGRTSMPSFGGMFENHSDSEFDGCSHQTQPFLAGRADGFLPQFFDNDVVFWVLKKPIPNSIKDRGNYPSMETKLDINPKMFRRFCPCKSNSKWCDECWSRKIHVKIPVVIAHSWDSILGNPHMVLLRGHLHLVFFMPWILWVPIMPSSKSSFVAAFWLLDSTGPSRKALSRICRCYLVASLAFPGVGGTRPEACLSNLRLARAAVGSSWLDSVVEIVGLFAVFFGGDYTNRGIYRDYKQAIVPINIIECHVRVWTLLSWFGTWVKKIWLVDFCRRLFSC